VRDFPTGVAAPQASPKAHGDRLDLLARPHSVFAFSNGEPGTYLALRLRYGRPWWQCLIEIIDVGCAPSLVFSF